MRRTPVTELEGSPEGLAFTPGVTRDVMNANPSGYLRRRTRRGRDVVVPGLLLACALLLSHRSALALNPSLEVSQYAHTAWRVRDGFSLGAVFAMAQTPDGYLWLGSEFGLFRFDGVRFIPWQPPAGQRLPENPYSLLVTRDGTLWIGTFAGLASWNGGKLIQYPELDTFFVTSLLEDREGTVWAGILRGSPGAPTGRLCAIRSGRAQCYLEDGAFGSFVWSLGEDSSGALWAGAESGLWRWKPGPPRRYATPGMRLGDLSRTEDGRLLIGVSGAGLGQLVGDKVETYPIRSATNPNALLPDRDVDSNKLLRDRDGGLWIGTHERGLIHIHQGRTDVLTKSDGLSGDISCSIFEDREGNVWVATVGGLDRFRELPVTTVSKKQGLSSDAAHSVLAATDGSIWVATREGLTRRKNGQTTIFRKASGLPDDFVQSLYEDYPGRIWVFTGRGLAYFNDGRFVAVNGVPSGEVYSIAGDKAGNLWLSGNKGLSRLLEGRFVEHFPWSALGRQEEARVVVPDQGGVWLSFARDGGVSYFKDGQVRASYSAADGLGEGHVPGLRLDADGALWAATKEGGLSRIKDGRIATLTSRNGLPCDSIFWTIEDDDRSLWLYTACGLVRIVRSELDAWIADPARRIEATVWDAADGIRFHTGSPATFGPPVAKSSDGKLWFLMGGEGIHVLDPRRLVVNQLPPPVYIEQVTADGKSYDASQGLRLPPLVRDLSINYTALSLVAPEKMRFRFKLEGQDQDWREITNDRRVQYSNLAPGHYRFRVMASNNSGVWNEKGALLDFSIAPAFYQTNWFRLACGVLFLALLWAGYRLRVRQLRRQEKRLRDVIEGMPTMAFSIHPDGSPDLVNRRWLDYIGLSADATVDGRGWEATIHPDDAEAHLDKWRAALSSGEPFENEVRHRSASGEYRWFLVRAVPFRDREGRIVKWYGSLTDMEDRKRAEEERERLRRLEAELAHTHRVSMLGALAASLAHELSQPIAAAITGAAAALLWLDRDQPEIWRAREAVMGIKDDGKRAADIIAHLKSFYKKDASPQREVVAVNEVVGEMLVLLHSEAVHHSVVMRTELAADLHPVRADRVQLQQVLMNLMLNGIQAMREAGGELTIRTRPEEGGVLVSVSDTGVGLPADQKEQIFNAFFTTKTGGTGMGLAISRSIVEAHGGRLWAADNEGRGATFHFSLSAADVTGNAPEARSGLAAKNGATAGAIAKNS
jgi:PAS domain S-box-containing protein